MLLCRTTTGQRHAEMKWSNHEKLDAYGVRLEGWPTGVPKQNPSTLSSSQNKAILEALESGKMKFVPIKPMSNSSEAGISANHSGDNDSTLDTVAGILQSDRDIYPGTGNPTAGPRVVRNDTEENPECLERMLSTSTGFLPAHHEDVYGEFSMEQYRPNTESIAIYSPRLTALRQTVQVDSQYDPRSGHTTASARAEVRDQVHDAGTRKKRRVESVAAQSEE
jgi:hypothetical protein